MINWYNKRKQGKKRSAKNGIGQGIYMQRKLGNARHQILESIKESSQRKHEATMKRERALAYAYAYKQQQQSQFYESNGNGNNEGFYGDESDDKPQMGWNWLERWMLSQPWQELELEARQTSYALFMHAENMSEKTVEMGRVAPSVADPKTKPTSKELQLTQFHRRLDNNNDSRVKNQSLVKRHQHSEQRQKPTLL